MKIKDVKAFPLTVPFKKGVLSAHGASKIIVVVKIFTDEGITGIGEPCAAFRTAPAIASLVEHSLKPYLVGQSPLEVERIWSDMYRGTFNFGRKGLAICAMSGIEQALWDIVGKAYDIPVYQMLGGASKKRLQGYASLYRYINTKDLIRALEECLRQGYSAIKLHQNDVESVKSAREVVGDDIELMLDVNCAWHTREAVEMAKRFQEYGISWLEEPVWPGDDYEGLAAVRAAVDVPIALGENEYALFGFKDIAMKGAADIIQPSVAKIGIGQGKQALTMAHTWNLSVSPQCFYLGPALAATLHLAVSDPSCLFMETLIDPLEEELFIEPLKPRDGTWEIPDRPGLGVEINDVVMAKYPYTGTDTMPFWCA